MSEQQINQIMKELGEQNKVLQHIREEQKEVRRELQEYKEKLEPVHKIFESVNGFNSIMIWFLKALILFGAGTGIIWGFIQYLKK